jgi:hypothetical protein
MRSRWWLLALALGCGSNTEPQRSAVADISGRVLSKTNVAVPATRVEVRCEGEQVTAEGVTSSDGVYALAVIFPTGGRAAGDTAPCEFASPTFAEPRYRAEAEIALYARGIPHPMQRVDLHEVPVMQ